MNTPHCALFLSLLLACKSDGASDTSSGTSPTTDTAPTSTTIYPGCAGEFGEPCLTGDVCGPGVTDPTPMCHPNECVDDSGCASDEFCYGNGCFPKGEIGWACPTGANACTSGVCGTVAGEFTCVDACQFRECRQGGSMTGELCATTPDGQCEGRCSWYRVPGFTACAPGFLCVSGWAAGAENGHYCWPEEAGDYGMPGASCKLDEECATKNCVIYDAQSQSGTCQWSCLGGCPSGQSCNSEFPPNFCE